jgi:hypothetical protein
VIALVRACAHVRVLVGECCHVKEVCVSEQWHTLGLAMTARCAPQHEPAQCSQETRFTTGHTLGGRGTK